MRFNIQIAIIILLAIAMASCGVKSESVSNTEPLDANMEQMEELSIVQVFRENEQLPMTERIQLFYTLKSENPAAYDFDNEEALNFYGYQLLWNNQDQDAFLVFKMLVSEFPSSANVYDSYGEICLKMGDKSEALINYRRSLELNPDNFNAEDQIAYILDPSKSPEDPADKFLKVYEVGEYRKDLDELSNKIIATHPNVFKFISETEFRKLIEKKKDLITSKTTFAEFIWHCDEIIASVNCSHTSVSGFYQEMEMLPVELSFPMQTRWINDQLFVIDPMSNGDQVNIRAEITSINGLPVGDLLKEIYRHLPSQGYIETTKRHLFNVWSSCLIPYAMSFPDSYTITLNGSEKPILLSKAKEKRVQHDDPSIGGCEKDLCLEFVNNSATALLTIGSFDYYKFRNSYVYFENFIDSCFQEINSKNCKHLIIDVRHNGGGSQSASIHLLRYLVDKPFVYCSNAQIAGKSERIEGEGSFSPYVNRYSGKVYFLIDGVGNSTTGHFMSIAKVLKLGVIVGEELGSNQFCTGGGKMFRLPHTRLVYTVAEDTYESMAISLPDETGILPDIYVIQSVDDYLNMIDTVKEHTLKLIEKNEE